MIGTILVTLGNLNLVPALMSAMTSFSDSDVDIGVITISASDLGMALAVALATVLLTVVVDFLLVREVFPRLDLRPGAGYAVATLTRWTIGIVGGVLTLAALGVDTTKITVIAGALGVGIGFGLQNVVNNNFVSGLILIVERPVAWATWSRSGRCSARSRASASARRACVPPTAPTSSSQLGPRVQGSHQLDPVGPPAALRHRRRRRLRIRPGAGDAPVGRGRARGARGDVRTGADGDVPRFGDSSLDFRLLAWVSTIDLGVQAQNALRIAVLRKLGEAGIEMPFPQRDLHLPSAIEVCLQAAQG